jgi:hyperosmotically inducible periplasmic protein
MTRKLEMITTAAIGFFLAFTTLAQETPNAKADGPDHTGNGMNHARQHRLNDAAKASDVIGMTVVNNQGEKLGKVEDLAVDMQSGRIVQVILSTGGFLGIGDTMSAVPPGALRHDIAGKVLRLDVDKEKLAGAPKFETSRWGEYSDSNHLAAVYRYYGQEPVFCFVQTDNAPGDAQPEANSSVNPTSINQRDGTENKNRLGSEKDFMIPTSRLGKIQKASVLMGTAVKNLQDEKLGSVENLLVDLPSGRVVSVVISSGGFLGIDGELSAVPPTALRFNADGDVLQLDTTKEMLGNAPHFKAGQWPDFTQAGYAGGIYNAYKVQPYFSTNTATDADDTARNVRDRDNQTLTPLDQGNNQADLNTTAEIRKEIIAAKDMSVDARNVKIITMNGRVTLRGPVNTADEKQRIGEIAVNVAQVDNVHNQLEVKSANGN